MIRRLVLVGCLSCVAAIPVWAASPPLPMVVTVHPSPLYTNTKYAYIQVVTQPRIVCVGFVLFDDGMFPRSFQHAQTKVTSYGGTASWSWTDLPVSRGGTASVSCNNSVTTRTVNYHFPVLPATAPATSTIPRARMPAPFTIHALVSPNPVAAANYFTSLTVHTSSGARCIAGVYYNDGAVAQSFAGFPQIAHNGSVSWFWHVDTASDGGTASVTCMFQGKTIAAITLFAVKHR